jgi:Peptidase family S58
VAAPAGGVGTASVYLGDGIYVGAIVVVNSVGSTVDPDDCTLLGAEFGLGDEFAGLEPPTAAECEAESAAGRSDDLNTTIAVVATNASLEKAAAARLSGNAHDGLARAIDPIHTLADGDTVFGVATGTGTPLRNNDPAASRQLNTIFGAGATTLSRAVAKAMLSARTVGSATSYCDRYPSACEDMSVLSSWRNAGEAPVVTPRSFRKASKKLEVLPVPKPGASQAAVPGSADGDRERDDSAAAAVSAPSGGVGFGEGMTLVGLLLVGGAGLLLARRRPLHVPSLRT